MFSHAITKSRLSMKNVISPDPPKKENKPQKMDYDLSAMMDKPLYVLVWHECKESTELLEYMENMNMNVLFIDSCVYFGIDNDMFEKIEKPLLYSNDQFVANTLFDIYDHFQNL